MENYMDVEVIRWILYADDVVLFCKTVHEAERLLDIINDTCLRFGLTISFKKTKTQELAEKETLISVGENEIANVREFVYLGNVIKNVDKECVTDHQIAKATAKFNELRKVLTDINLNMTTRRKLLEACVRSRLTYRIQAWPPREEKTRKLEVFWIGCLRSMVKGAWKRKNVDEGEHSSQYTNQEVHDIFQTVPLREFIHVKYLRYIAHVCRHENSSITKKPLFDRCFRQFFSHFATVWFLLS